MVTGTLTTTTGEILAAVAAALDGLPTAEDRGLYTDGDRLELAARAVVVAGRLRSLAAVLVGEADGSDAATRAHGTSTVSWLAEELRLTRREAAAGRSRAGG